MRQCNPETPHQHQDKSDANTALCTLPADIHSHTRVRSVARGPLSMWKTSPPYCTRFNLNSLNFFQPKPQSSPKLSKYVFLVLKLVSWKANNLSRRSKGQTLQIQFGPMTMCGAGVSEWLHEEDYRSIASDPCRILVSVQTSYLSHEEAIGSQTTMVQILVSTCFHFLALCD